MGKKKKNEFEGFRKSEKSPYKTIKTTLKSLLRNKKEVLPCINNLVCEVNDLVIHSYQFIRLYILKCYNKKEELPEINDKFISYCIKTLGVRDNRGKKSKDTELLDKLNNFYELTYQPLLNHKQFSLMMIFRYITHLFRKFNTLLPCWFF